MSSIPDGQVFRDAKNRRCIAYNSSNEHCLVVGDDGGQTFTLQAGDTNSACCHDTAEMEKVRSMAVPYERAKTGTGFLPVGIPVFFEGRVLIGATGQRITAWWFLLAQIQRITNPTSPPVALQIESVKQDGWDKEYFRAVIRHPTAPFEERLDVAKVLVPRKTAFTFRIDYTDAAGGPDGRLKIVVTVDGMRPQTVCDYRGPTGFPDNEGLYPGWGIYGADQWAKKQLPLVMRFDALDWGLSGAGT